MEKGLGPGPEQSKRATQKDIVSHLLLLLLHPARPEAVKKGVLVLSGELNRGSDG